MGFGSHVRWRQSTREVRTLCSSRGFSTASTRTPCSSDAILSKMQLEGNTLKGAQEPLETNDPRRCTCTDLVREVWFSVVPALQRSRLRQPSTFRLMCGCEPCSKVTPPPSQLQLLGHLRTLRLSCTVHPPACEQVLRILGTSEEVTKHFVESSLDKLALGPGPSEVHYQLVPRSCTRGAIT